MRFTGKQSTGQLKRGPKERWVRDGGRLSTGKLKFLLSTKCVRFGGKFEIGKLNVSWLCVAPVAEKVMDLS